jgi:hypothetical protein
MRCNGHLLFRIPFFRCEVHRSSISVVLHQGEIADDAGRPDSSLRRLPMCAAHTHMLAPLEALWWLFGDCSQICTSHDARSVQVSRLSHIRSRKNHLFFPLGIRSRQAEPLEAHPGMNDELSKVRSIGLEDCISVVGRSISSPLHLAASSGRR